MILHVFNGDIARNAWKKTARPMTPSLAWRENYLEGRIPPPDRPLVEFEAVRAAELHRLLPDIPLEKLLRSQRAMSAFVLSPGADDTIYLWFDACMYDQIMLSRVLFLLRKSFAAIRLVCEDLCWGAEPELFQEKAATAERLGRDAIELYSAAWTAFANGFDAVAALAADARTETLSPYLAAALTRYTQERPDERGLGLTERRLTEIVRSGVHDRRAIFAAAGKLEEHPFMGDTMCFRLLAGLAHRGVLECRETADGPAYDYASGASSSASFEPVS